MNRVGASHMPPWSMIAFTLTYLVTAIVGAFVVGNKEFLFYIAVMAVLIALALWLDWYVDLTNGLLWCLSIWGLLHMAGGLVAVPESWPIDGNIRVLYSWWLVPDRLKYDQVVHAYGFGCATWGCWQCLRVGIASRVGVDRAVIKPAFGFMVLCAVAGMGFGALNEVIEFAATQTVPETNVGGYVNTGWDLVSNMIGSFIAAGLIWWKGRGNEKNMKYHEEHKGHKVMHKGDARFEPISSETEWAASQIVDAALAVHKALGPGLLESVYEACLCHELATRSISFRRQVSFPISYGGLHLDAGLKIDLIVSDCVIVEIKSVDEHHPIFEAQLLTYLRLTGQRVGLLVNFNVLRLKDGIKRLVL